MTEYRKDFNFNGFIEFYRFTKSWEEPSLIVTEYFKLHRECKLSRST